MSKQTRECEKLRRALASATLAAVGFASSAMWFASGTVCATTNETSLTGETSARPAAVSPKPFRLDRFQGAIDSFVAADKTNPPSKHVILFIGSSIFRQWTNLTAQMSPLPVFNRAFGGSRTAEVLHYMDKIVLPYEPRIIVYYCGSNDVNAGEPAAVIADRFHQFVTRVQAKLPATQIFFVSINRAPQKQDRWNVVDAANGLVKSYCATDRRLGFIDVNPVLFDSRGEARLELYKPDNSTLSRLRTRNSQPASSRCSLRLGTTPAGRRHRNGGIEQMFDHIRLAFLTK